MDTDSSWNGYDLFQTTIQRDPVSGTFGFELQEIEAWEGGMMRVIVSEVSTR
jgi:hypothetical protein